MAETNGSAAAQDAAQPTMPKMQIMGQFIRDMSFENIAAQKALQTQAQPDIQVQVGMDARKRDGDGIYDVIVKMKIDSKTKEEKPAPIFLLELEYGGVFKIENIDEKQLHPYLMIECPRMLFPFIRRIVSDVTRDGGYPPLNLDTIDFVQLYRNQIAQRAAAAAATTAPKADA